MHISIITNQKSSIYPNEHTSQNSHTTHVLNHMSYLEQYIASISVSKTRLNIAHHKSLTKLYAFHIHHLVSSITQALPIHRTCTSHIAQRKLNVVQVLCMASLSCICITYCTSIMIHTHQVSCINYNPFLKGTTPHWRERHRRVSASRPPPPAPPPVPFATVYT